MNKNAWTSPILTSAKIYQMSDPKPLRSLCRMAKHFLAKVRDINCENFPKPPHAVYR